jgi:hypothetical protein
MGKVGHIDLVSKPDRDIAKIMAQALDREVVPAGSAKRPPIPSGGTSALWAAACPRSAVKSAAFLIFTLGVMWVPTGWVVKSALSLENGRGWTPALLSGPRGRGPALTARPPTELRAAIGGTRATTFRLLAPAAREVFLGGSFNGFNGTETPLVRGKEGIWEITVSLPPGRHTYKFKVDGEWLLDPTNPDKTPEPRESSLIDVPS